jgi:Cdc6-like AAA superfamily ATPase
MINKPKSISFGKKTHDNTILDTNDDIPNSVVKDQEPDLEQKADIDPTYNVLSNDYTDHVFTFNNFDIRTLMESKKNLSALIYGKRRTGKTVLVRDLLYSIKDWYSDIYVFSQTASIQSWNFEYADKNNIYNGLDIPALEQIWNNQEKYIQLQMEMMPKGSDPSEYKKTLEHIVIVFDDVIADSQIRSSPIINNLFIKGRHYNIAVFILSQEFGGRYGINKVSRANTDLIISFYLNNENDRKSMVEQFLSTINKKNGEQIFKQITNEPYTVIVIANFETNLDPEKYVYKYKANPDVPKFSIPIKKKTKKTGNVIDPYLISKLRSTHPTLANQDGFIINFSDD